jgi:hypothetical protein
MTNNTNLGKRIKNQNHTCTIHRKTTNSSIPLGSNIKFLENNHKCVPFGLLITNINLLLLLLYFFLLAVIYNFQQTQKKNK